MGPPAAVLEIGKFMHACEGEMVVESTNPKIPHFNAPIYLENKVFFSRYFLSFALCQMSNPVLSYRHQLAKSTKSSAPSTKSTSPSNPPRGSKQPPSSKATSSTSRARSFCHWKSSCPSPSRRRALRLTRSRSPAEADPPVVVAGVL
jgi:hypothetical protein